MKVVNVLVAVAIAAASITGAASADAYKFNIEGTKLKVEYIDTANGYVSPAQWYGCRSQFDAGHCSFNAHDYDGKGFFDRNTGELEYTDDTKHW